MNGCSLLEPAGEIPGVETSEVPASAVETRGLSKCFGETYAVRDLDLTIPQSEAFGLIGVNGAGKTTTLRMLMGLTKPSAGSIRIAGVDALRQPHLVRQRIGFVPDLPNVYPWMRVRQAIEFCRSMYPGWNAARCDEMLHHFRLEPKKRVKQLSRGMKAKLALVLAIVHDPEVLILDEPMSGLDPIVRDEFLDGTLRVLCDGRQTVLFSTHVLSDIQRVAQRVGILHRGRLLFSGRVSDLTDRVRRIRAVLVDPEAALTEPLGTVWQRRNGREWLLTVREFDADVIDELKAHNHLERIDAFKLSLEEIFKDLVRGQESES